MQEEILANRNSYSKTDPDATFMRMKEDHMLNGQLNLQPSALYQQAVHSLLQYASQSHRHQNIGHTL